MGKVDASPRFATIKQLAAALGVSPCWLAFGCEVDHGNEPRTIKGPVL